MRRRLLPGIAAAGAAAAVLAGPTTASQLIDRDASRISLRVNAKGVALVEYRVHRAWRHVLAWGAINARMPQGSTRPSTPQVRFRLDYSGGWGTYRKLVWRSFRNACKPYDGPELRMVVASCTASDGSYWALQAWQVELPDFGFIPWTADQRRWHLQLSHWTGPVAELEAYTDWIHRGRIHNVFGRVTYRGLPVHGYGTTPHGVPTDKYGRLVYLDTYDSAYGPGWRRENAFVAHRPNGNFCWGFYRHDAGTGGNVQPPGQRGLRPKANGTRYRITVQGPGVTPDVVWEGKGLPNYNPKDPALVQLQREMLALNAELAGGDRTCRGRQ